MECVITGAAKFTTLPYRESFSGLCLQNTKYIPKYHSVRLVVRVLEKGFDINIIVAQEGEVVDCSKC